MDNGARTPSFGRGLSRGLSADGRYTADGLPRIGSKHQCEDQQCAEEGLDPETFGDDKNPPVDNENLVCGIDKRPLLPLALAGSTMASGCCILFLHMRILAELDGDTSLACFFFLFGYLIVLGAMGYTALADPGQVFPVPGQSEAPPPEPRRSHKAWLYSLPIRRYDHYCRWLCNVIGLLNHRSFVAMCGGLTLLTCSGGLLDLRLIFFTLSRSAWSDFRLLLLHLGYVIIVLKLLGPIFWMHVGFVSRNELAYEWKENYNYVAFSEKRGALVNVNDLSDDEFNDKFDFFEYDSTRNPWDKGTFSNCWAFWFTPRHEVYEMGEF